MKIVQIEQKQIRGIGIRTTNEAEMSPDKGRIAALWQSFDKTVPVDYKNGKRVYGIYYNYESDANGEFSVLAGTDQVDETTESLDNIQIQAGKYLVFDANGAMPQVVIDTWGKIWDYFSNDTAEYQRLFTTDFEYYKSENEIEVCIAVK